MLPIWHGWRKIRSESSLTGLEGRRIIRVIVALRAVWLFRLPVRRGFTTQDSMMWFKRLAVWGRRLTRKPWWACYIDEDFVSTEKWFWTRRAARNWADQFGRWKDGGWKACYASMWDFPTVEDVSDIPED